VGAKQEGIMAVYTADVEISKLLLTRCCQRRCL
jgi:hypothetical protein